MEVPSELCIIELSILRVLPHVSASHPLCAGTKTRTCRYHSPQNCDRSLYLVHGGHNFCTCHIPHGKLHYAVHILPLKPICPSPGDSPSQSRDRNSVIMVSLLSGARSRLQFCSSEEDMGLGDHSPLLPSRSRVCVAKGFALTLGSSTIWCTVSFSQLTQEARSHQ